MVEEETVMAMNKTTGGGGFVDMQPGEESHYSDN